MAAVLARRLLWAALVLFVIALVTFTIGYQLPADPARTIAGPQAPPEAVAAIRRSLGLDQPYPVQLARYLGRVAAGDLGYSHSHDRPVLPLILERVPATSQLALGGAAVALLAGIPLGVAAAARPGTRFDRAATLTAVTLASTPAFWLAFLLLDLLAFRPRVAAGIALFPIGGYRPLDPAYLVLPSLALGLGNAAVYARLTRTTMLDELGREHIRTARAKGLTERGVRWRHAFPNAAPALLAQFGVDLGTFLGGVVVVEQVFAWPGVGRLAVDAILAGDVPLITGTVLFATLAVVVVNLVVDLVLARLDPRLRH